MARTKYKPYSAAKKGKKKAIKIRFKEVKPMSKSGFNRWGRTNRSRLWKEVNVPTDQYFGNKALLIPVEHLSSRDAIKQMCEDILWEGKFYMHGYSHRNTPTGCGLTKALVKVEIKEKLDGTNEAMIELMGQGRPRLTRYWFWGKTPEQIANTSV